MKYLRLEFIEPVAVWKLYSVTFNYATQFKHTNSFQTLFSQLTTPNTPMFGINRQKQAQVIEQSLNFYFSSSDLDLDPVVKPRQYAPGHFMTILRWKFSWNPLRNVGGVAHRRNCLRPPARPTARPPALRRTPI
jgi:hypothetical protein